MVKKDDKKGTGKPAANVNGAPAPSPANAMPLFYSNPTPLDSRLHANIALKQNFGFGFANTVNAVPINMVEMPQIANYYPIAFSPDGLATPVAILGLRDNENLFVGSKGEWLDDAYIPAYVRRYPFIFSEAPGTDRLTLCIDMDDKVIDKNGSQTFFDKQGQPMALAQNAMEFCKSYHAAAQQTQIFSQMLAESGLLIQREAQIIAGKNRINFSGFNIIDENVLAGMEDKKLLEWHKKGFLPFLYAQLFSGSQWQRLSRLLNSRVEKGVA